MNQKWKTLIISLLTPSSIISGFALIVLWGYFSRLGRLDIFFDVMNIKSILEEIYITYWNVRSTHFGWLKKYNVKIWSLKKNLSTYLH